MYRPVEARADKGAGPAVLALLGGHIDAVAVSPAEVTSYVASGKLKMLAVMADHRVKGFENVPTLKERHIDLSIGTWRGLAAPRNTPPEVISYLKKVTLQAANEPAFRATLDNQNLGFSYADDATFKANVRCNLIRAPLETAESAAIVGVVQQAAETTLRRPCDLAGLSFWTDAATLHAAGIPTVLFGPIGAGAHATEEWVDLDSVQACAEIYLATAMAFCQ